MKVWSVEANGQFCGGMAIVAATDAESAVRLAATIRTFAFKVRYSEGRAQELSGVSFDGDPRVITHYEMGE